MATAKQYMSCVHTPIISDNPEELILDIIPPPELHLMIGVVNTLFNHMLKEFNVDTLRWENACQVRRETKRGASGFNGNASKRLLDNVDILRSSCSIGCIKYVQALHDFRSVVSACFGMILDSNFVSYINNFKKSYLALNISVTLKVHAVFFHVTQFCSKHNKALGFYSEQAIESTHFEFKSIWDGYGYLKLFVTSTLSTFETLSQSFIF